jgi:hypothetical protein
MEKLIESLKKMIREKDEYKASRKLLESLPNDYQFVYNEKEYGGGGSGWLGHAPTAHSHASLHPHFLRPETAAWFPYRAQKNIVYNRKVMRFFLEFYENIEKIY